MKLALVGPVTDVPERNRPAFEQLCQDLERIGHVVASPTHLHCFNLRNVSWEDCLAETIPRICRAEAIVVLPDWMTSRGSILEVAVALLLKKPIYRLVDGCLAVAHADLGPVLCRLLDVFAPEYRIRLEEVDP